MKIKYLRLTNEEKAKVRKKYFDTKAGLNVRKFLSMSMLCSVFLIIISIFLCYDAFYDEFDSATLIFSVVNAFFGLFILYYTRKIYIEKINNYLVKKK